MSFIKRFLLGLGLAALITLPASELLLSTGCTTTNQTTAFQTLSGVEVSTDAAYKGYLDLVVGGKVSTNSVPTVAKDYDLFQFSVRAAIAVVQGNTNAAAPQTVLDAAAKVTSDIAAAKGGK